MMVILFSFVAIGLYLAGAWMQFQQLRRGVRSERRRWLFALALGAVICHGVSAFMTIATPAGIDLGFFRVSSLIFWFICTIALLGGLRRPLDNLALALGPLAALAIVTSLTVPSPEPVQPHLTGGIVTHILSSILAYSVLTLAALQAALLALQDRQLKHRHTNGVLQALPPLQTMESILFELLWVGVLLLSASIVSGWLFLDDIFAQHLVHKTALSITAWVIFATLLWGRHALGWRSHTAVRWTLGGFIALMLSYFGTKMVLELILS